MMKKRKPREDQLKELLKIFNEFETKLGIINQPCIEEKKLQILEERLKTKGICFAILGSKAIIEAETREALNEGQRILRNFSFFPIIKKLPISVGALAHPKHTRKEYYLAVFEYQLCH